MLLHENQLFRGRSMASAISPAKPLCHTARRLPTIRPDALRVGSTSMKVGEPALQTSSVRRPGGLLWSSRCRATRKSRALMHVLATDRVSHDARPSVWRRPSTVTVFPSYVIVTWPVLQLTVFANADGFRPAAAGAASRWRFSGSRRRVSGMGWRPSDGR